METARVRPDRVPPLARVSGSRGLDPVTAARPSSLQAARLSALAHDCRLSASEFSRSEKKKKKRTREESIFAILQIETPDQTNTGEILKSPTAEGNKLRNPLESGYNA